MSALHHLFTGLLYLVILLHPRGKVYCFRPRSLSISISSSTKKKFPPHSSSCSSSSPPSSPLPPPAAAEKKPPPPSYELHYAHFPAGKNQSTHEEVSHERSRYQVLELDPREFSAGVVQKMFQRGWTQMGVAPPPVHKILKINHSLEALIGEDGFESYRKRVQGGGSSSSDDGRLLFDGNEIVGYWCCHLPNAPTQLPTMPMPKEILVSRISRRAHEKMHENGVDGDSRTRAMFVCRAIAGRVGEQRRKRGGGFVEEEEEVEGGGIHAFDSLAVGQDLLMLDAKAILPCFIVVFEDDDGSDDKEGVDEDGDGGGSSSPDWTSNSGQPTCSLSWYMRPMTK